MKIGLCLPAYDENCKTWFALSLWRTRWPENAEVEIALSSAQWVCNAMKQMVEKHLKWGADFIVLLATDVGWRPDDIKKLIEYNFPIVSGWASGRCAPFNCHVCDAYDKEKDAFRVVQKPMERKGVEQIVANGGELIVFRKDIFEKIPSPWFFGTEMIGKDRMSTEDYFFAKKAMQYGVDMYVDWDVKLQHATSGLKTYNGSLIG